MFFIKKYFYILILSFLLSSSFLSYGENIIPYRKGSLWGYCDRSGHIVVSCKYIEAGQLNDGIAKIKIKIADKVISGYIFQSGFIDLKPSYSALRSFSEGLAAFKFKDKWGFFNKKPIIAIRPIYDQVGNFHEGMANVKSGGKYGFINSKGKVVIPLIYEKVGNFSEGLAPVKKNGKWGFINSFGEFIVKPEYKAIYGFSEGLATVQNSNSQCGCIDKKGKVIIPFWYTDIRPFSNGLAAAKIVGEKISQDLVDSARKVHTVKSEIFYCWLAGKAEACKMS